MFEKILSQHSIDLALQSDNLEIFIIIRSKISRGFTPHRLLLLASEAGAFNIVCLWCYNLLICFFYYTLINSIFFLFF
jgi:hypothetical protein